MPLYCQKAVDNGQNHFLRKIPTCSSFSRLKMDWPSDLLQTAFFKERYEECESMAGPSRYYSGGVQSTLMCAALCHWWSLNLAQYHFATTSQQQTASPDTCAWLSFCFLPTTTGEGLCQTCLLATQFLSNPHDTLKRGTNRDQRL